MQQEVRGSIPLIVRNDDDIYQGDLKYYFKKVFFNANNLNNPYHNLRHLFHVTWSCYQACIFYRGRISQRDMRDLLIAALFHDFDHTGKAGPDSINIERSIYGLRNYLLSEDELHLKIIEFLIQCTEYPYTIPSEKISIRGKILRDADISQAMSPVWIQQVVIGLAKEWNRTPLEVLKMQEPFLRSIKFNTLWAQSLFPEIAIEEKIAEARELLEILES